LGCPADDMAGGLLPRIRAGSHQFDDFINAVRYDNGFIGLLQVTPNFYGSQLINRLLTI
jgi:hypothetical protein